MSPRSVQQLSECTDDDDDNDDNDDDDDDDNDDDVFSGEERGHPQGRGRGPAAGRAGAGPLPPLQLRGDERLPVQHQVVPGRQGVLQIHSQR